ncbi:hypothetical protein ACFY7H_12480 [Streptomyces sp. NPDC012794]|uniref:LppU/SCO3897 family protein n=1 Tax=Streptomyces sp. NPDC012794 TaxID=3364850 RepID=UPI0036A21A67
MATPPPQYGAGGPYEFPARRVDAADPHLPPYAPAVPQQRAERSDGYTCRVCGCWPAVPATVRGHQGLLVLMRFLSVPGPFCRDCGTATYRRMSSDTLWQGWWGPLSLFVTPVVLLLNLGRRAAFRRLGVPSGGFRPPLDPGRPLWRRPPAMLFLVPALLLALGVPALVLAGLTAGDDEPPVLTVGQCVRNVGDWSDQELLVTGCGSPKAQYRVSKRLTAGESCAPGDFLSAPEYGGDDWTLHCLTPLR